MTRQAVYGFLAGIVASGMLAVPLFSFAAVVINEVLFNPSKGSDTGLEKIELYNSGESAVNISGWELFPDGIGYFIFPGGFTLGPKSFVTVHLRLSGTSDASNLYHSITQDGNMGDSSGSVAIFSGQPRGEDTIIDFVRYKKGTSDTKTWESDAAKAGLWTAGDFVDISSLSEGNTIGLGADGARSNAASWNILASPSIGAPNAPAPIPTPSPSATSSPPLSPQASSGSPPVPSIKAAADSPVTALAGAMVTFRGMAFGLDGELLSNARFLWVFGDGSTQEGKVLSHIYHFPGTYRLNLLVSSGEYTGSDWRTMTVVQPELKLSEVKAGPEGFVEIFNGSDEAVELGGMTISDDQKNIFRVPRGTMVNAEAVIVLPNIITGLNPFSSLLFRDARGGSLDEVSFGGVVPPQGSWERAGNSFSIRFNATPGAFNPVRDGEVKGNVVISPASALLVSPAAKPVSPSGPQENSAPANPGEFSKNAATGAVPLPPSLQETASSESAAAVSSRAYPRFFFAASVITSLFAAAAFLLLKRNAG